MKPLKARHFKAEDLLPSCLVCEEPVRLGGQSQGWTHNSCVEYPPSAAALKFKADEDARRRRTG